MDNLPSDPYELPADSFERSSSSGLVQATSEAGSIAPKKRGPWMMVVSAIAVLTLVGGGGLLALQAFTSVSQEPAKSMPPDTSLYFSVDLLQLTGESTTGALVDTVRGILERLGEDVAEPDDLIADLDAELRASAGFDFSNDIQPWIGRTIGVGIMDDDWDPSDYASTPDALFAVEVRNEGKAAEFLQTLQGSLAREGVVLIPTDYQNVELLIWTEGDTGAAIAISDGMLLAGTTRAVQRGIDAQSGRSLADSPSFIEATASLPDSRLFTGWIDAGFYQGIYEDILTTGSGYQLVTPDSGPSPPNVEVFQEMMGGWKGAALAVTVTEAGIAFDGVVLFEEGQAPDWYTTALLDTGSVPALLPSNTLAFVEYGNPAGIWSSTATALMGTQPSYEEELDEFEEQLGFHPIDDFVAYLDGSMGIALLQSQQGLLAAETGYPIGLVGFAGTSSPDPLRSSLEQLNTILADEGMQAATTQVGGDEFYVYEDAGDEVVAYGVTDERLMIGTSSDDLARIGANGDNLTANPTYAAALDALDGEDFAVAFFADVAGMIDVFGATGDVRIALEPFTAVVGASRIDGSLYRGTLLVLIDYD
jgi:hypothetical protein